MQQHDAKARESKQHIANCEASLALQPSPGSLVASWFNLNSDLLRRGKVVPGVGGGVGCIGSGGEVDHGELSGGAHREPQEQRAAPQLCVGRSVRDRPSTYVITLGATPNLQQPLRRLLRGRVGCGLPLPATT
eukprot:scaffold107643_cov42-Phaeocystis_antarctica.AAC.1